MLELYHNVNSVCAQKVRIALAEKGQQAKEHLLTLQGEQNYPAYMKLNPNGVVPMLTNDGNIITKSSLIVYYIDDVFPRPALMPSTPNARHRVRMRSRCPTRGGWRWRVEARLCTRAITIATKTAVRS